MAPGLQAAKAAADSADRVALALPAHACVHVPDLCLLLLCCCGVVLVLQAGAGCNSPIFAEIVPDELRSTIYAFDRCADRGRGACVWGGGCVCSSVWPLASGSIQTHTCRLTALLLGGTL